MKKTVAMLYYDSENMGAMEYIEQTIANIFTDNIDMRRYYISEMHISHEIPADAYVINGADLLYQLRNQVKDTRKMIILERSARKSNLSPLMKIPEGTNVLVVNDSIKSTIQTMHMLLKMGITHLNLTPYDSTLEDTGTYDHFHYAITANEPHLVPAHIKHVIDIGYRELSFQTILSIAEVLGIKDSKTMERITHYFELLQSEGAQVHNTHLDNMIKEYMLNSFMSDPEIGILVFSRANELIFTNETAKMIFDNIEIPDFSKYSEEKQKLIVLDHTNYLFDKSIMSVGGWEFGYTITLRDEKSFRSAESVLNKKLKEKGIYAKYNFDSIISNTASMKNCIAIAKKAAKTDYTILLTGESGSGKELLAQSIHNYSDRSNRPFIAINCAALPDSLLESELFGYESGAFTGAKQKGKAGLFEQANSGTIFLDEIGDISENLQAMLLRVLQEKQVMRVGSDKIIDVDVRIIAATNQDLRALMEAGKFRKDLFYRLSVIPIKIPPLRERRNDILALLKVFLGSAYENLSESEKQMLCSYDWPGNVREIENAATFYLTLGTFPEIIGTVPNQTRRIREEIEMDTAKVIEQKILGLLAENSKAAKSTGRVEVLYMLRNCGIMLSDGKLRGVLAEMADKGLITIGRGRQGTAITEEGKAALIC